MLRVSVTIMFAKQTRISADADKPARRI